MDERRTQLEAWLREVIDEPFTVSVASADASFRRYFRVHLDAATRIAMDAPPEQEDCRPFVDIARRLRAAGLNAPDILASDLDRGFLLLTDLGSRTFLEALADEDPEILMQRAIATLARMQAGTDASGLPDYDTPLLKRELSLYPQWYVAKHAGATLSQAEQRVWEANCERLVDAALSQPQVFVHRDYMLRNLMLGSDDEPGVIDFQDAVRGPVSYDLLSLFRDAFISFPEDDIARWREDYHKQAEAAGVALPDNLERAMDFIGIQRHLKVIGIFARLHYRDGKAKYLAETPRFHRYIYEIAGKYPEFDELVHLLKRYEVEQ